MNGVRPKKKTKRSYLGSQGAAPSCTKQQELQAAGRKQRFKQKLKEADRKITETGQGNKVENLQKLVCRGKTSVQHFKKVPKKLA